MVNYERHNVPMPVILSVRSGPDCGVAVSLTPGDHTVGRAGSIQLSDPHVSRLAAVLRADSHGVRLQQEDGSFQRLPTRGHGTHLRLGNSLIRLADLPAGRLTSRHDTAALLRVAVPLVMALALIPIAWAGPPWRWTMVAIPTLIGIAALVQMRRPQAQLKAIARRLPVHPADVLTACSHGERGVDTPMTPRPLSSAVQWASGEAWSLAGPNYLPQARWLAGWLALTHSPAALQVDSPWISTVTAEVEPTITVRFRAGTGRLARSPGPDEVVIVYGGVCPWAVPLPTRRTPLAYLRGRGWYAPIPSASASFCTAAQEVLHQEDNDAVPTIVPFSDLIDVSGTAQRWRRPSGLAVPLGKSAGGENVVVDLIHEGPHALVAGTTGAGKSELLTTWLLGMAAHVSAERLNFLLVDFKGGAAFGPLTELPHSVALLTDLQPAATTRALSSLRAQIRRREEIIARAGARNIDEYERLRGKDAPIIARLVIVIDEFAALASDHPDILDQILRIATQGRSLGIHLIAATQRPAGSVTAAMRANMPLRICLRVTTASDSADILDSSEAASLPSIPGRGLVRRDTTETVQTAWCGTVEQVRSLVELIDQQWQQVGGGSILPPWAPELPQRINGVVDEDAWGLADDPAQLRHVAWRPPGRNLLIVGGAGSGKSSAAVLAAQQLAGQERAGREPEAQRLVERPVYFIGNEACARAIPTLTGWIPGDAVHLSRMLVDELTTTGGALVIDDVNRWRLTIDDALGPGSGMDLLERLVRASSASVLTGDPNTLTARWASFFPDRLLLGGVDDSAQALAGMPADMRGEILPAGRGRESTDWQLVQLRVPGPGSGEADRPWHYGPVRPELPGTAPASTTTPAHRPRPWAATLPHGRELHPPPGPVIITGPAKSGRSTAAVCLADDWRAQGHSCVIIDDACQDESEIEAALNSSNAVIVVTTAHRLATTMSGPLAMLKIRADLLVLQPARLGRASGLGSHLPGWAYAPDPRHSGPGTGLWVSQGDATPIQIMFNT